MTMAQPCIKVLLADDHQLMREGIRRLLAEEPGLEVVADAGDGRTAVKLAGECGVDVVVMDVTMPDLNGIEATRQLKALYPAIQVVGLSMHADREFVTEMLGVGASGYVLKNCPFGELVAAIRAAAAREVYLSPKVAGVVVNTCLDGEAARFCGGNLTPREREILQFVADGKSSKEIAYALELSVKTVDTHRRQVMEKLKLFSIAELTHYAIRQGVTTLH
jgi:DNA-binding NarL/FixJ family response regulator